LASKKGWTVTFTDGTEISTPYHPNARMAAGEALSKHKGKISSIRYG
jgi:hypothetical protein